MTALTPVALRRSLFRWALPLGLAAVLAACTTTPMSPPVVTQPPPAAPVRQPELTAFRALLSGAEVVPASTSPAMGELVAVLNRDTGLLQWRLSFEQLSGPVRAAHFHSPAMEGEVAAPVLAIGRAFTSPYEGRAMLTPAQRKNLMAGQWYVNLRTARYPDGEIRGQLIEQH
ncbi:MAG: CHRD domain-containing protein [Pseudomonadota bacterium]|nr:CHRD domain-containing protein [Pseudomonadota bacterium]